MAGLLIEAPEVGRLPDAEEHKLHVIPVGARGPAESIEGPFVGGLKALGSEQGEMGDPLVAAVGFAQIVRVPMPIVKPRPIGVLAGKDGRGTGMGRVGFGGDAFRAAHEDAADPFTDPEGLGQPRAGGAANGVAGDGGEGGWPRAGGGGWVRQVMRRAGWRLGRFVAWFGSESASG